MSVPTAKARLVLALEHATGQPVPDSARSFLEQAAPDGDFDGIIREFRCSLDTITPPTRLVAALEQHLAGLLSTPYFRATPRRRRRMEQLLAAIRAN